jgi:nucleotide sugar dehydrogenase
MTVSSTNSEHSAQGQTGWCGEPDKPGTVAVVGLGKIGLPLASQYASAGWRVIGVDVIDEVVDGVNRGVSHVLEEPGVAGLVASAHERGAISATTDHAAAARQADVVIMAVPIMLDASASPDYRFMDAATEAFARGLRPGALVVYETTLPVGDTAGRYRPMIEHASGLNMQDTDRGFYLAFSPERVYSGRILTDLQRYPKLVGGVDSPSARRAVAFYRSVLEAEVWDLGSAEAAEFAKLAETTYRDVNIALANEFARYAESVGNVDITRVIEAANSQPFSHIHQPGIGVGGHCIPVYPHFLLSRGAALDLVRAARKINDAQTSHAIACVEEAVETLENASVLVLGLTYRHGVRELAYSRGVALVSELLAKGARVAACDPLMGEDEIRAIGALPHRWGEPSDAIVIVTQTADPLWATLDTRDHESLRVFYDGRNSLRDLRLPAPVRYLAPGLGPSPMSTA